MTPADPERQGLLAACSLVLFGGEGPRFLGTGTLIAPDKILTCSHVIGDAKEVEVRRELAGERVSWARLCGEAGDPESPYDLALLHLDTPLGSLGVIRFDHFDGGQEFRTAGWTQSERHSVQGKIMGVSGFRNWLEIDALGTRKIERGCSGSAAWVGDRGRAAGIVVYRWSEGLALVIPTWMIQERFPDLPAPVPKSGRQLAAGRGDDKLPNIGVTLGVRLLDGASQALLGQGVRLDRDHVLTLTTLVAAADRLRVLNFLPQGVAGDEKEAAPVAGDPCVQSGLSLLLSPTRERLAPLELYTGEMAAQTTPWRAAVWLDLVEEPGTLRRLVLGGTVGRRSEASGRWRLELTGSMDSASLLACRGAGVFVNPAGGPSWQLAGALSLAAEGAEGGGWSLELCSLGDVTVAGGLADWLGHHSAALPAASGIEKILDRLEKPGVAAAILESRRNRHAAADELVEDLRALAQSMVESDVNDVAEDVARAHQRAVAEKDHEAARYLREVFEKTVPMALRASARQRFPDRSAVDVRIDFFDEVLVELNLAAADEGDARYLTGLDSEGREASRRVSHFAIDSSGQYGPDFDHRGSTQAILEDLKQRFIFDRAGKDGRLALDFLAQVALSEDSDGGSIIESAQLRHLDRTAGDGAEGARVQTRELLKMINEGVGSPTETGRRLYFLLSLDTKKPDHEKAQERALVDILRELLPALRVVERGADEAETATRYRRFSNSLTKIYGKRTTEPRSPDDEKSS